MNNRAFGNVLTPGQKLNVLETIENDVGMGMSFLSSIGGLRDWMTDREAEDDDLPFPVPQLFFEEYRKEGRALANSERDLRALDRFKIGIFVAEQRGLAKFRLFLVKKMKESLERNDASMVNAIRAILACRFPEDWGQVKGLESRAIEALLLDVQTRISSTQWKTIEELYREHLPRRIELLPEPESDKFIYNRENIYQLSAEELVSELNKLKEIGIGEEESD
ncbi:hypothetical protein IQ235_13635 [Oscillatoriales cyanobacterium LEGE 11467]|uniref:Uncharacterized protein n=1 Tax=Zarconia navalis LEGE 11467 TaxID=1828826 RepID=A0A928VZQ6_9CYAN|nr:hypothetical protein [Zarconia navalis]MBE9041822.1 hypothetical protein [Zarconia navalis LEGE 11467]